MSLLAQAAAGLALLIIGAATGYGIALTRVQNRMDSALRLMARQVDEHANTDAITRIVDDAKDEARRDAKNAARETGGAR